VSNKAVAKLQTARGEFLGIPGRHHISVAWDLTNGASQRQQFYIPFTPDEMVVRAVAYSKDTTNSVEPDVLIIRCANLDLEPVALVVDPGLHSPGTTFNMVGKNVNTTWDFTVEHLNTEEELSGYVAVLLEFVKW